MCPHRLPLLPHNATHTYSLYYVGMEMRQNLPAQTYIILQGYKFSSFTQSIAFPALVTNVIISESEMIIFQ